MLNSVTPDIGRAGGEMDVGSEWKKLEESEKVSKTPRHGLTTS